MADFDGIIDPAAAWADIPQLSVDAVALGGAGGPMNAQALAIAKRIKFLKQFQQPQTGAVIRDTQDKQRETVTPYDFGAVGGGIVDDGAKLQLWLDCMVANPTLDYSCVGTFKTSIPLVADFNGPECSVHWNCKIKSSITTADDVLTFKRSACLQFNGFLFIYGTGSTSYSSRKNRSGLVVSDCSRFSYDTLRMQFFGSHGVQITGTTSQPSGKYVQSWYCGSSAALASVGFSANVSVVGAKSGTTNSVNQSQALEISSPMPGWVDSIGWFLKIGSGLYKIISISSPTSISVYPWLNNAVAIGDDARLVGGSGYYSIGGDTSAGRIDTLDSLTCGIGFQSLSLYPSSIGNYVSQSNGISMVFGIGVGSAVTACDIGYFYSENDVFGVVNVSSAQHQLRIGPTVTFPADRSFRMAPRLDNGTLSTLYQSLGPGFSYESDNGTVRGTNLPVMGSEYSNMQLSVEAAGVASYVMSANTQTLTLRDPSTVNILTGIRAVEVTMFGSGANGQPTGTITLTPPATHTLNGGAAGTSLSYSGLTKPMTLRMIFVGGTAWRVARWDAV